MAVARPELTVAEIDWLVSLLPKQPPVDQRRGCREIKRAQQRAHDLQDAENAHLRKIRRAHPQAPDNPTEYPTALGAHARALREERREA